MRSRGWPAVRRSGRGARFARGAAMCASRLRRSDRRRAAAHACRLSRSCPRTTTARHRARGCPHASRGAFDGRRRPIGAPRRRTSRPSRPVRRALRPRGARGPYRACPHRTRAHPSRAVRARRGRQGDCRRGRQGVRRCAAPASRRCGACAARTPRRAHRAHRARRRAWRRTLAARAAGVVRGARLRDALAFGCRGRARRPRRALRRSVRRAARRRRLGSRCGLRSRLRRGGFRARRFRVGPRDLARGEAAGADGGAAGRRRARILDGQFCAHKRWNTHTAIARSSSVSTWICRRLSDKPVPSSMKTSSTRSPSVLIRAAWTPTRCSASTRAIE
ncbi:putative [Protein-PII] uridylyltransferase [Burkholderia pseudomallei 576]|nr:putative [Protein-PII] uridylyltransferase [Burkholderia pseudomallei 576]